MSETVSLELLGRTLREVQAEQRSLRTEQGILRRQLSDAITTLLDRIGQGEALLIVQFDRLNARLDQTERSVEERLSRIEALLMARPAP